MHDEVSETENIRKNLAIERMIIEGCEILLDTSQTFVRQGEQRCPRRRLPGPTVCCIIHTGAPRSDVAPTAPPSPEETRLQSETFSDTGASFI